MRLRRTDHVARGLDGDGRVLPVDDDIVHAGQPDGVHGKAAARVEEGADDLFAAVQLFPNVIFDHSVLFLSAGCRRLPILTGLF